MSGRADAPAAATSPTESGPARSGDASRYASHPADLPEGTLVELFFRAVDEFDKPDAYLWRSSDTWQLMAHREVLRDVHALSDALVELGIERGDRVAILSENRPEWAVADFAILCTGALAVPVYPTLPANQAAYILQHSAARLVFISTPEQLAKVLEVRQQLPALEWIVAFEPDVGEPALPLPALLQRARAAGGSENTFRMRALAARPEDVATIIYTSGTTGQPKGVMLTHDNLHANVTAVLSLITVGPADVALSFLPLSHGFQRLVDYAVFANGASIAYVPSFDEVARALLEVKPTIAVSVPRVYEKIYASFLSATGLRRSIALWARGLAMQWAQRRLDGKSPGLVLQVQHAIADRVVFRKLRARLGGRIRFFVSGGAPLSPQIALFFYGAGVTILEGYGLTETSPVVTVNPPGRQRIGSVGPPVPGTEIRIADDGEILVRGRQVMKGYFDQPDASRQVVDEHGWFQTGDIGTLDADGYLRITDRKKELLKTAGGKYIAPQPIENAAKRSRYVAEALVIGDRRPYPILLIVPDFRNLEVWAREHGVISGDRAALVKDARVLARLEEDVVSKLHGFAHHEMPKKVLALDRELSLERGEITPTLKPKRRVVEEHFANLIDASYARSSEDKASA